MKSNELEVACSVCPNCKRDVTRPFGYGRECALCSWRGDGEEMLPTVPVSDLRSRLHDIEDRYINGIGHSDSDGYVPESKLDRYEEAWKKLRQELADIDQNSGDSAEK